MNPQDRGPLTQTLPMQGDGSRQRIGRIGIQRFIDHAFARDSRQDRAAQIGQGM